jgi:hypothetical protein
MGHFSGEEVWDDTAEAVTSASSHGRRMQGTELGRGAPVPTRRFVRGGGERTQMPPRGRG